MAYRKLSASYIYSVQTGFLKKGILILDKSNTVIDLIDTFGNLQEASNLEYYNGILTPGFVNLHCHLFGEIPLVTKKMITKQNLNEDQIQKSIKVTNNQMRNMGIVAETDNSGSNDKLSLLEKMFAFQQNNPQTHLKDLLKWVTINGARTLGIESQYGSFEKGKQPGVNLIEQVDLQQLLLTERSRVKKIV